MKLLPYGPLGWLVEVEPETVLGYLRAVEQGHHPDVVELVPAARTVLVRLRDGGATQSVAAWLTSIEPVVGSDNGPADDVRIGVRYDGEDLAAVAGACGLALDEVVSRHAAGTYECAFCGFAPGFAYLRGLDPDLRLPRRATPRTRVPAGAVAIADEFSAVYPSVSPGGWHLIGRTDATLWDPNRDPPAMIAPGTIVRFVPS